MDAALIRQAIFASGLTCGSVFLFFQFLKPGETGPERILTYQNLIAFGFLHYQAFLAITTYSILPNFPK